MSWNFGIFNSLKKHFDKVGVKLLPAPLPNDFIEYSPFLVVDINGLKASQDRRARADITLTLINKTANHEATLPVKILKTLNTLARTSLHLFQGCENIGEANIKIGSIDNKHDKLMVKLSTFIFLRKLYYDI